MTTPAAHMPPATMLVLLETAEYDAREGWLTSAIQAAGNLARETRRQYGPDHEVTLAAAELRAAIKAAALTATEAACQKLRAAIAKLPVSPERTTVTTPPTDLPTWAEMTDVDKGCALLHLHKRRWEGASYAIEEYPCRYLDNPRLVALAPQDACRHAVRVGGSSEAAWDRLGEDEFRRLYELALDEPDLRCMWGVRHDVQGVVTARAGGLSGYGYAKSLLVAWTGNEARYAAMEPRPTLWKPADQSVWAVMHRTERAGQWHEVGGCGECRDEAEADR